MTDTTLDDLRGGSRMAERWRARGLRPEVAQQKSELLAAAAEQLIRAGVDSNTQPIVCFVPGRIEVLGKHTDYAGGRSLLVAVDRGFCTVAAPRTDRRLRVLSNDESAPAEFEFAPDISPTVGHWSNYPMTVARRLARNFPGPLLGADIVLASDLPRSAGMSSSSALMIATYQAIAVINHLDQRDEYRANVRDRLDLAGYLATIENGMSFRSLTGDLGVGTFGGSEDHTAILFARPGEIVQYSYCPVRFERSVKVADDLVFAVAQSGIVAEKTGDAMGKYNRVSQLARSAVEVWRAATGRNEEHIAAILASSNDAFERLREVLQSSHHATFPAEALLRRVEQFREESESIIPSVPDALDNETAAVFGSLVDRSQSIGARLLENQTPETIWLADWARKHGAIAASAFGAGFGGSVWALVREDGLDDWLQRWSDNYATTFPVAAPHSCFFATRPGPSAFVETGT